MSLSPAIDALGLVGTTLGTIRFIAGNVPSNAVKETTIRIKAGLPGDDDVGLISDIHLKAAVWRC